MSERTVIENFINFVDDDSEYWWIKDYLIILLDDFIIRPMEEPSK